MKFLCPNCKAKYQISDEKISGRTLKMDCRRCGHPIVIRGDRASVGASSPGPDSRRTRSGAPRHRGGSHVGPMPRPNRSTSRGTLGADFRRNPGSPAAQARPSALDQWHVAINDVPVGPMKRDEVARKISSGAVTGTSLIWREGFDDWRKLRDVPDLASLLTRAQPAKPPAPPPPRGRGGRGLGRPPPGPAPRSPQASRPGAMNRDADRPAAHRAPPPSPRAPTPGGPPSKNLPNNVVPIGGRLGAAPAFDQFSQDFEDDAPTTVGAPLDVEAHEEAPPRDVAPSLSPDDGLDFDIAEDDALDPGSPAEPHPTNQNEPAAIGSLIASSEAGREPSVLNAVPVVDAEAGPERRRRPLPMGAWIALAGAMSFGVALAVVVGTRFLAPSGPAVTMETTATAPQPQTAAPAPIVDALPVPDPPETAENEAENEGESGSNSTATNGESGQTSASGAVVQPRNPRSDSSSSNERSASGGARSRSGSERQLTAAQRARLEAARGASSDQGPAAINVRNPLATKSQRSGTSLNRDQIATVVRRGRSSVQRCYESAVRSSGSAPRLRIDVDISVGASGGVTRVNVRTASSFGNLSTCVERTVRRWRFPPSGGATQTSIPFVFQGRE